MDNYKILYKLLFCLFLFSLIEVSVCRGGRYGFRSYRYSYSSYSSYRTYYYYSYSSISTGSIIGIVMGSLIGIAVLVGCCVFCCTFCCALSQNSDSNNDVNQAAQQPVSTISSNTFNSVNTTPESGVQFTYDGNNQYNTKYSAPPPSYDDVIKSGTDNAGFR